MNAYDDDRVTTWKEENIAAARREDEEGVSLWKGIYK